MAMASFPVQADLLCQANCCSDPPPIAIDTDKVGLI
jgi:hypothetical protein